MRFQATLENLPKMLEFVREELICDEQTKCNIEVSVEEALVNVIKYAYEGKQGDVEVTVSASPIIKITIQDWGIPFDPTTQAKMPKLDVSLEEQEIGGLGIFFMKQFMDKISYRREGNSNLLILEKKDQM